MKASDYHRQFVESIRELAAILKSETEFREIDERECYLKAVITFTHGYTLRIAEYVVIEGERPQRLKYRYQLLDANQVPISPCDNAPHHKHVSTFPHHRHDEQGKVHSAHEVTSLDAIAFALEMIERKE